MLEVADLCKSFHGNPVLRDVAFAAAAGEVHAVIGENGAGKSTLVNVIAGIVPRDSGEIRLGGRPVAFEHPAEAMRAGISVVHQELSLVPNATVAENIYLRREATRFLGFNDWRAMNRAARAVFDRVGLDIDPAVPVGSLSIGVQQIVELAKAIALEARLVIMDEPTSSLSDKEIGDLFRVVRDLQRQGLAIVFISHKLSEIFTLADRVTVLRDGRHIATRAIAEVTADELIRLMVGRPLGELYPPRRAAIGEVFFTCRDLSRFGAVADIGFELRRGEILGLAGLVGSGRTEAMRALVNADRRTAGRFTLDGAPVELTDPADAMAKGIVYLSEDRKRSGLFLGYDVAENIVASTLGRYRSRLGLIDGRAVRRRAREAIAAMDIRPASDRAGAIELSGGNQQKVLFAKALDPGPRLLIADEPTRGVDIGAKALIHARLRAVAESGVGVIVVSSEMPELLGLSDRILVFRNGRISAALDNGARQVTQEAVMTMAAHH